MAHVLTRRPDRLRTWPWPVILALAVVLLGFCLRVYRLEAENAWYDEGYSVFMARQPIGDLPRSIATDGHPIVYFALLHGWSLLTGESLYALRYLSVIFGVLSLAVGYRLTRHVAGPGAALLATALLVVHRPSIWYSQEIRMYGLGMLLGLVALGCALVWVERGGWRALVGYGIAVSAGLQTLYLFGLAPIALNLAVIGLLLLSRRRDRWRALAAWLVAQIATVLSVVPWMAYAWPLRPHRFTSAAAVGPLEILGLWLNTWLVGTGINLWDAAPAYLLGLSALALTAWAAWRARARLSRGAAYFLWANLAGAATTIVIVWLLNVPSSFQTTFTPAPRYLLALVPWAVLGLGAAVAWLATVRHRLGVVAATAMLALLAWPVPEYFAARTLTDAYRSTAMTLTAYRQPGDALLLHNDGNWPVVDYDLGVAPRAGVPNGLSIDPATAEGLASPLWNEHDAVWLVITRESLLNDFSQQVLTWFKERAVASREWDYGPYARLWLFARTPERAASLAQLAHEPDPANARTVTDGLELVAVERALPETRVGETLRLFLYWRASGASRHDSFALRLRGLFGGTADEIPLAVDGEPGSVWRQQVDFPIRPYVGAGSYQIELTAGIGGQALGPALTTVTVAAAPTLPAAGEPLAQATSAAFQNGLTLQSWEAARSGPDLIVRVRWQVAAVVDRGAKQFWHVVGPEGSTELQAQADAEPLGGAPPISAWPIGAIVPDQIAIRLPDDLAPGRYTILTGLYDPVTGERVPVLSTSDGGNVIALGRVDLP